MTHATPTTTATANTTTSSGATTAIGQRPVHTAGDMASRPLTGRSSKPEQAYEKSVGIRPERSSSSVVVGRQQGASAGAGAGAGVGAGAGGGALRAPAGSGGGVRARVGDFKTSATRRVLGAEGPDREGKGIAEKTASRSVFDMDDDSD